MVALQFQLGPREPVEFVRAGDPTIGTVEISISDGSILRVTRDIRRWPKPRLQRSPGPQQVRSPFDTPAMTMVRGFSAAVAGTAWFEDTTGGVGRGTQWTTGVVRSIVVRRARCGNCFQSLMLGKCRRCRCDEHAVGKGAAR